MENIINCKDEIINYFKKRSDVYFDTTRLDKNVKVSGDAIKIYSSFFIYQNRTSGLFSRFIEENNIDTLHKFLLEHIQPILKKYSVRLVKLTIPSSVNNNDKGMGAYIYIMDNTNGDIGEVIGYETSDLW